MCLFTGLTWLVMRGANVVRAINKGVFVSLKFIQSLLLNKPGRFLYNCHILLTNSISSREKISFLFTPNQFLSSLLLFFIIPLIHPRQLLQSHPRHNTPQFEIKAIYFSFLVSTSSASASTTLSSSVPSSSPPASNPSPLNIT